MSTAVSIGVGSKNGVINYAGDADYFKFVAPSSATYRFNSSGNTDVVGYLYGSNGVQLAYDDDSAGNRQFKMDYRLTAGQTYYVAVLGFSSNTGAYTINVNPYYFVSSKPLNVPLLLEIILTKKVLFYAYSSKFF